MYKTEKLRLSTINEMLRLNSKRISLNVLNEDFHKYYRKSSLINKYLLRKQVYLLKYDSSYIGYMWYSKIGAKNNQFFINSLYVENYFATDAHFTLPVYNFKNSIFYYDCKLTYQSSYLLSSLGFIKKNGTYELSKPITELEHISKVGLKFIKFKKGKHERLRCDLQNEIFSNSQREPLTVQDIYLDEMQEYYVNDWCILLQYDNEFIGYGQIIMSNLRPLIVNFGIKDGYRERGFGDILLCYLLNLLYSSGYKEARIKVNTTNEPAFNLYKKKGFNIIDEYYTWAKTM